VASTGRWTADHVHEVVGRDRLVEKGVDLTFKVAIAEAGTSEKRSAIGGGPGPRLVV